MARKYSGPLQPGRRSAYVPGTRRTYRKKMSYAATRIQRAYRRYKYQKVDKRIQKVLNSTGENKFQGFSGACLPPVPKPAGTQPISYHFLNSGVSLAASLPEYATPMSLFRFPQGDGPTERNGNSLYIKQSYIKGEIQMLPVIGDASMTNNSAVEFRMLLVKANRKYNPLYVSPDPGGSLYLDTQNSEFGYDGTVASTFLNMNQPINKRRWVVMCDKKFTLSPPSVILDQVSDVSLQNPKYAIKKRFRLKLPVFKKCHFAGNSANSPENVDTQWLFILQAVNSAYCNVGTTAPRNYALNIYGTTTASDM